MNLKSMQVISGTVADQQRTVFTCDEEDKGKYKCKPTLQEADMDRIIMKLLGKAPPTPTPAPAPTTPTKPPNPTAPKPTTPAKPVIATLNDDTVRQFLTDTNYTDADSNNFELTSDIQETFEKIFQMNRGSPIDLFDGWSGFKDLFTPTVFQALTDKQEEKDAADAEARKKASQNVFVIRNNFGEKGEEWTPTFRLSEDNNTKFLIPVTSKISDLSEKKIPYFRSAEAPADHDATQRLLDDEFFKSFGESYLLFGPSGSGKTRTTNQIVRAFSKTLTLTGIEILHGKVSNPNPSSNKWKIQETLTRFQYQGESNTWAQFANSNYIPSYLAEALTAYQKKNKLFEIGDVEALTTKEKEEAEKLQETHVVNLIQLFLIAEEYVKPTPNNKESSRAAVMYTFTDSVTGRSTTVMDAPGNENKENMMSSIFKNYNGVLKDTLKLTELYQDKYGDFKEEVQRRLDKHELVVGKQDEANNTLKGKVDHVMNTKFKLHKNDLKKIGPGTNKNKNDLNMEYFKAMMQESVYINILINTMAFMMRKGKENEGLLNLIPVSVINKYSLGTEVITKCIPHIDDDFGVLLVGGASHCEPFSGISKLNLTDAEKKTKDLLQYYRNNTDYDQAGKWHKSFHNTQAKPLVKLTDHFDKFSETVKAVIVVPMVSEKPELVENRQRDIIRLNDTLVGATRST